MVFLSEKKAIVQTSSIHPNLKPKLSAHEDLVSLVLIVKFLKFFHLYITNFMKSFKSERSTIWVSDASVMHVIE